jgi:threonine/homoserine/homoserine lactone efflux protein
MIDLFILGFALAATPGPDFVLILDHTLAYGRRMGLIALAGNRVSFCIHLTFALLGLSAILVTFPGILVAVKLLGAGFLVYLGVRKLLVFLKRRPRSETTTTGTETTSGAQAFRRAFFNNLLNPNVSLFFLSFFPQFANSTSSLGLVAVSFFVGNSSWWLVLIAVAGVPEARARIERFQRWLDLLFGVLFIGFGFYVVLRLVAS